MGKVASSKSAPRAARGRRSRAEVEEEFSSIASEIDGREPEDPKSAAAAGLREQEVRQAVDGITAEGVAQRLSSVGIEASRALARVSEQLLAEVQELERVREAVALERAEIGRLHKIDIAATALDQLVADYNAKKALFEAEIESARNSWAEEEKTHERTVSEQEEAQKKAREREAEEYEYKKAQERKKAQDKFNEQMAAQDKQNRERQETLEKGWLERETALKAREEEYATLKKDNAEFPKRLEREVTRAAAEARDAAKKEHDVQIQLMRKDFDADTRVAALQIKSLEELTAKQLAQISDLQAQIAEAKRQVQDIAVKALESAAGAKTLEEVRQIAREQAKRDQR